MAFLQGVLGGLGNLLGGPDNRRAERIRDPEPLSEEDWEELRRVAGQGFAAPRLGTVFTRLSPPLNPSALNNPAGSVIPSPHQPSIRDRMREVELERRKREREAGVRRFEKGIWKAQQRKPEKEPEPEDSPPEKRRGVHTWT